MTKKITLTLTLTLLFIMILDNNNNNNKNIKKKKTLVMEMRNTEIGGFEDGGFKVGVEPTERELGATGSHWRRRREI